MGRLHLLPGPFAVTLTLGIPGELAMAQSGRYVVTGVEQNIEVGNWQITARERLAWLEAFNEWLARCGLEWAGPSRPRSLRQQRRRAGSGVQ